MLWPIFCPYGSDYSKRSSVGRFFFVELTALELQGHEFGSGLACRAGKEVLGWVLIPVRMESHSQGISSAASRLQNPDDGEYLSSVRFWIEPSMWAIFYCSPPDA